MVVITIKLNILLTPILILNKSQKDTISNRPWAVQDYYHGENASHQLRRLPNYKCNIAEPRKWFIIKNNNYKIKKFWDIHLPGYRIRTNKEYLDKRSCVDIQGNADINMTAIVSVLDPTLWNIFFDLVFDLELPAGMIGVGFVNIRTNEITVEEKCNKALRECNRWLRDHGIIIVALEKRVAMIRHVSNQTIELKDMMK